MSYGDWVGEDRRVRAYRMYTSAADHHIARAFPRRGVWVVRSQRRAGITYSVNFARRTCTCADFLRNAPTTPAFLCKHLYLIALLQRGGRLLRVRGRAFLASGPYLELKLSRGVEDRMTGRYAVKALSPLHAFVVDIETGKPVCGHAHEEDRLRAWFTSGAVEGASAPCPHCIGDKMPLLIASPGPKNVLTDEVRRKLRRDASPGGIGDRGNAILIDEILHRYIVIGELHFFDVDETADDVDEQKKDVGISDEVFKMMLGLMAPAPTQVEFEERISGEVTYTFNAAGKGKAYAPLSAPDLATLWKMWDPRSRIMPDGNAGSWTGKVVTKEEKAQSLYDLVFNPTRAFRGDGKGGAQRGRGVVVRDSMMEKLDKDAPPEFRLRIYGQSRCDEVVSRNLGLASLSSYQKIIQWAVRGGVKNAHSFLLHHDTGSGKCLGRDTPVLMFDGTFKKVQNVVIGDALMGDDDTPRAVQTTCTGREQMASVTLTKGEQFTCNLSHVLSLRLPAKAQVNYNNKWKKWEARWHEVTRSEDGVTVAAIRLRANTFLTRKEAVAHRAKKLAQDTTVRPDVIIDISVKNLLDTKQVAPHVRRLLKAYHAGPMEFGANNVTNRAPGEAPNAKRQKVDTGPPIAPYALGYWLGDGTGGINARGLRCYPGISTGDDVIVRYFEEYLPTIGTRFVRVGSSPYDYRIAPTRPWGPNAFARYLFDENLGYAGKRIPDVYKYGDTQTRLEVLAGILDADGSLEHTGFNLTLKSEKLMNDVVFVARSLGFNVHRCKDRVLSTLRTTNTYNGKVGEPLGTYKRISINGDTTRIPVKTARKVPAARVINKDAMCESFTVVLLPEDDYFGFTLDGNCRFVVGEGMVVTHNTASLWLALGDAWKERFGRFRKKYFFVTKQSLASQQQPAKDVWAFYHAAGDTTPSPAVGSYAYVREQRLEAVGGSAPPYVRWKTFLPTSDTLDTSRIVSYGKFSNMCRRGNSAGRAIYDYEAAHEIANRLSSDDVPDDTPTERILAGGKEAILADNFPAALLDIKVARAARGRSIVANTEFVPGKPPKSQKGGNGSKAQAALDKARDELLEFVEYESGVRRDWDHLQFLQKLSDSGEKVLQARFTRSALRANIAKRRDEIATLVGADTAGTADFYAGVIDPLRDAVIAIDEADVLFSASSEISDARVGVVERAIFHSYEQSGSSAVRVILGTATPAQLSVRDAFRLLNLLVRTKEQRVQGVGSGGLEHGDAYVDADKSPTIKSLAGGSGDFETTNMNVFMNVVKDGISRVDLARDFDHFPHRMRHTVTVAPSLEHQKIYNTTLSKAFKGRDGIQSPGVSPAPSPGQLDVSSQTPEGKIRAKARKLRAKENLILPTGEKSVPFEFRLGHPKFAPRELAHWINTAPYAVPDEDDPVGPLEYNNSPKLIKLLETIREIDDAAHIDASRAEAGVGLPKHAIICDAKQEFGAPLVAAALAVAGYPWRPIQRYRADRRELVRLMDDTIVQEDLPLEHMYKVGIHDARKSAFTVLSAQQLDYTTETAGDNPFLQRGKEANENTEFVFVGALKLRKLLGRTGPILDTDPLSATFKAITKGGVKKIFRPPGWGEDNVAEGGNNAPLDEMFLTKSIPTNKKTANVYAILRPLLEEIVSGDTEDETVVFVRDNIDKPKRLFLLHLQRLGLVEWRAVLSAKQRTTAPKTITKVFNSRKENFDNSKARIIVIAPEFATGTDLFEVEHIHLFDATEKMPDGLDATPTTRDRIQMEGRAWRRCGHAELRRRFGRETHLHIYEYRLDAGRVSPKHVLAYMRNTAGRKPGVDVVDVAKPDATMWQFDDVLQALRTDPVDAAALRGINAKIEQFAFDKTQNDIPAQPVYTPLYTGYVHTGGVATPLYRSVAGGLVDVNGSAVDGVDDTLLDLWIAKRVRWDKYAGAWTGVADREQSSIEVTLAETAGGEIDALIMLANAAFSAGDDMQQRMEAAQSVRGVHATEERHLQVLRQILKEQEVLQKKRKGVEKAKYDSVVSGIKELLGFARNEEHLAKMDSDDAGDAAQTLAPQHWWRARAALYRARFTALPLRSGRDLQWEEGADTAVVRAAQPRRAAAAESPAKPAGSVTKGRPQNHRWYPLTRAFVREATERAGFVGERRLARDLWFGSHVTPDLLGNSLFVDVVTAIRRMRASDDEGAETIAAYVWNAFADLGDARTNIVRDVMTDGNLLARVVRIATWLPARKFRADVRFYVGSLKIALPTVVARIQDYALAPGTSGRKRRTETVKALVSAKLEEGSIMHKLGVALDAIFGVATSVAVRRVVIAYLPVYYDKLYAYQERAAVDVGAVKPHLAVGILDGIAKVVRFFDKPSRLSPTGDYMRITALGREMAQPDSTRAHYRRIWITAVLAARAVEEGVFAPKTTVQTRIVAAIQYLYTPLDDLHENIQCYAGMRRENVLTDIMHPDDEEAGEGVSADTAANILYTTYGDRDAGMARAREIIRGKKRPTYLTIADTEDADNVFPGGRGEALTMTHSDLTSVKTHEMRYADVGGKLVDVDPDKALAVYDATGKTRQPWSTQIAHWIATGLVDVTDADAFAKIGGMADTVKSALETIFVQWIGAAKVSNPIRNTAKAYLASLDAGVGVNRTAVWEYLNARKDAIHWVDDADWKKEYFSLLAVAEPHWDAVIRMRDLAMRVFITLDAKVALRIAISGNRAVDIGALQLDNPHEVADFIANKYVKKVTVLSTVTTALTRALSSTATDLDVSDRRVLVQWILSIRENWTRIFALYIRGNDTPEMRMGQLERILNVEVIPRGIAILADITANDPRNFYADIMKSDKAKEVVAAFWASIKPAPSPRPMLPSGPLPPTGRVRPVRPFQYIADSVLTVLKHVDMRTDGFITVEGAVVSASEEAIRQWDMEMATKVRGMIRSIVRELPEGSLPSDSDVRKSWRIMQTAINSHGKTSSRVQPIGAGTQQILDQPLRIVRPPGLHGDLVPQHLARQLVWRVPDGNTNRLALESGRVTLPSGRVLDPWEEDEDIVVEFF